MQAILFDADGVTIRPTEPFSGQYQKKHGVPSDAFLKDFFGGIFHDIGVSAENVVYFDNEEEIIVEAKKMGIRGYVYESPEQVKKRINTPI